MHFVADKIVFSADRIQANASLVLALEGAKKSELSFENAIIYPALINSHDHLVGNWFPAAISKEKFPNSHIWVEEMRNHPTYLERNQYWINDGSFLLTKEKEMVLCKLGVYKNLFSGVVAVQDHAPKQKQEYYDSFPIEVVQNYTQCHSLPLGNWWGGESAEIEFAKANGKLPFILHLGEGIDEITAQEFSQLKKRNLLAENTLMIHGIALSRNDISEIAQAGASICWCPASNQNLIGDHLDINACLEFGVNVVLGTDSTLSGSVNLLAEMRFANAHFRGVSSKDIFKMVSCNAAKALRLEEKYGSLDSATSELLVLDKFLDEPFDNLIYSHPKHIKLLVHNNKVLLGDRKYLEYFDYELSDYTFYNVEGREKFVIGDYHKLTEYINSFLTYTKKFPYLPSN